MAFIFMVVHWPQPDRIRALADSMREMRAVQAKVPGCIAVEPPYLAPDRDCLVGISKWESAEAFFASGIQLRPAGEVVEGEVRPRDRYLLEEL